MPTVFITANDTGVGKTWVTTSVARILVRQGATVQVVKPVETGVASGEFGDAELVGAALQERVALQGKVTVHTLHRYALPMAPVESALREGATLDFDELVSELQALPNCDWRIIEGAGGLAVPLSTGETPRDWADFAQAIDADFVALVIEDRLGAINQARLLAHYAKAKSLNAGWWLNQPQPNVPAAVREVNESALADLNFPLWAAQDYCAELPRRLEAPWLMS
ncbi:dethiobiotin synthase [Cerasicoccus arenae]|uniref:ATP-dependent dethiobiotin synthetase BioD n=1 Tax=Cerasicoccus arenae TaxID=424488 RepID=A0A8J3DAF8_9BACT|nr:dethiobiotin synthase [Cerasicoccus arenae]MBK1859505.1 dethiobiotin synthase [Cerasicoccus arenae]GHB95033.1 ATP-dependent dethiobiotin synthetase BioD [Cerasicoccus arenae]